jgi:hypothetical protein
MSLSDWIKVCACGPGNLNGLDRRTSLGPGWAGVFGGLWAGWLTGDSLRAADCSLRLPQQSLRVGVCSCVALLPEAGPRTAQRPSRSCSSCRRQPKRRDPPAGALRDPVAQPICHSADICHSAVLGDKVAPSETLSPSPSVTVRPARPLARRSGTPPQLCTMSRPYITSLHHVPTSRPCITS